MADKISKMQTPAPVNEQPQQESFLEEIFDTRAYDKKIKQAQNGLFVVAVIYLLAGIVQIFADDSEDWLINIGVTVVVAAIFLALAFWVKKNPLPALVIAITLYFAIIIFNAIAEPASLVRGLFFKAAMVVLLIKGIIAADEARQLKKISR